MKILLSVGHSILKNGRCTSADGRPYGGILEYAYNKEIAMKVQTYLQSAGHEVKLLICPEFQFSRSGIPVPGAGRSLHPKEQCRTYEKETERGGL